MNMILDVYKINVDSVLAQKIFFDHSHFLLSFDIIKYSHKNDICIKSNLLFIVICKFYQSGKKLSSLLKPAYLVYVGGSKDSK